MRKSFFLSLMMAFSLIFAQELQIPKPSTHQKVEQDFSTGKIVLDYYRPNMNGRKIFGELVPFNQIWRMGANAGTKITFDQAVKINGAELAAGTYYLYAIPAQEGDWQILFSTNGKLWKMKTYEPQEVVLTTQAKFEKIEGHSIETLEILFTEVKDNALKLKLLWENAHVSLDITVSNNAIVFDTIDAAMAQEGAEKHYFEAAKYYFDNWNSSDASISARAQMKKVEEILDWARKAVAQDTAGKAFWMSQLEAEILFAMGKYADAKRAIETAAKKVVAYGLENDPMIDELAKKIEEKMPAKKGAAKKGKK